MSDITQDDVGYVAPSEMEDQELYHPKSWMVEVVVDNEGDYQAWLQEQQTFAQSIAKLENGTGKTTRLTSNQDSSGTQLKVSAR